MRLKIDTQLLQSVTRRCAEIVARAGAQLGVFSDVGDVVLETVGTSEARSTVKIRHEIPAQKARPALRPGERVVAQVAGNPQQAAAGGPVVSVDQIRERTHAAFTEDVQNYLHLAARTIVLVAPEPSDLQPVKIVGE